MSDPASSPRGIVLPQLSVRGPDAAELADLSSMEQDLRHVAALCGWLVGQVPRVDESITDPTAGLLLRAAWESCIISYGRCFTSGRPQLGRAQQRRTPMPPDVMDQLTAEERELHRALIEERYQHVAHQVSNTQQVNVAVVLAAPPSEPAALGVAPLVVNRAPPDFDDLPRVAALVERLAEMLNERIQNLANRISTMVNEHLSDAYEAATPRGSTPLSADA